MRNLSHGHVLNVTRTPLTLYLPPFEAAESRPAFPPEEV